MSTEDRAPAAALARVIISTGDLQRALAIYRDVLGYHGDVTGDVATLSNGSASAIMLHRRPTTPSDAAVAAAFTVDDLDAVVRAWEAAGVR